MPLGVNINGVGIRSVKRCRDWIVKASVDNGEVNQVYIINENCWEGISGYEKIYLIFVVANSMTSRHCIVRSLGANFQLDIQHL